MSRSSDECGFHIYRGEELSRCKTCGGMVVKPCKLCKLRLKLKKYGELPKEAEESKHGEIQDANLK